MHFLRLARRGLKLTIGLLFALSMIRHVMKLPRWPWRREREFGKLCRGFPILSLGLTHSFSPHLTGQNWSPVILVSGVGECITLSPRVGLPDLAYVWNLNLTEHPVLFYLLTIPWRKAALASMSNDYFNSLIKCS